MTGWSRVGALVKIAMVMVLILAAAPILGTSGPPAAEEAKPRDTSWGRRGLARASRWLQAAADRVDRLAAKADEAAAGVARRAHEAAGAVRRPTGVILLEPTAAPGATDARGASDGAAGGSATAPTGASSTTIAWSDPLGPLDATAEAAPLPARLVLLVHGLDEQGLIWNDLAPAIAAAGYAVARFDYPDDQAIAVSADALAGALRELKARGVARVDLVAHSMGGLVARDVLTRPAYYDGKARGHEALPDVPRLVMLGTPNAGCHWARLRIVTEVREQVLAFADDPKHDPRRLLGFLTDGDGEAGRDLLPGSDFLRELNSRPAPAGVAMTCVVATLAPWESGAASRALDRAGSSVLASWLSREDLERIGAAAAAVAGELGDGVVSAASARHVDIDDVAEVEGSHRGMLRRSDLEDRARRALGLPLGPAPGVAVVLDRLARPVGE